MIDQDTRGRLLAVTRTYWESRVQHSEFQHLATGKEIGHRIADYVEEHTTEKLHADSEFDIKYEVDAQNKRLPRSMGDMWIRANQMYNPVNVKAGEMGKNGQPNLVSLAKLLERLIAHQIDSYDLLIIKMEIVVGVAGTLPHITPRVFLVDMLDYWDFVTFDAGPGQAMLREQPFYDAVKNGYEPPSLTLGQKVDKCMALMEDGYARLLKNRGDRMSKLRGNIASFKSEPTHIIDQKELKLG